jgi:competence protein ComEC
MIAPIGIVAGLFIVPLTTVFMVGGMIWLVLDLFSLSFLLNFPLALLYQLMEIIASIAGRAGSIIANPSLILVLSIVTSAAAAVLEYKRRTAIFRLKPF